MIRFNSTEQFIEALEARRPALQSLDDRRLAQHRTAEKDHLKAWKEACREAAKWDYATLKAHQFRLPAKPGRGSDLYGRQWSGPQCPISEVRRLDSLLATLRATRQKSFTIDEGGTWRQAHHLLTVGDDGPDRDLCS